MHITEKKIAVHCVCESWYVQNLQASFSEEAINYFSEAVSITNWFFFFFLRKFNLRKVPKWIKYRLKKVKKGKLLLDRRVPKKNTLFCFY